MSSANETFVNVEGDVWEGSSVLFDDTWNHEVFNQSSGDRVVLLLDVLRPLPPLLHSINLLNSKGIIRMTYAKSVLRGAEKFSKPAVS